MLFKRAYVRGVNAALIRTGAVKYANEELAAQVADSVADQIPGGEPLDEVPESATADVAAALVELSNSLQDSADSAAQAASAAKSASLQNLRRKLSADTYTGATVVTGKPEQQNTGANAETGEAKMDHGARPDTYAVGPEGAQEANGKGKVVPEKDVALENVPGANSATQAADAPAKQAMLYRMIRKVAEGATITGDKPDQANTLPQAASETELSALDLKNRGQGYAVTGVGNSQTTGDFVASAVGTQQPHPKQQENEGGTNSAIEITAADESYLREFKAASAKYASALPFYLNNNQKIAAIQYLMGVPPSTRAAMVKKMAESGDMPAGLKDYVESKKEDDDDEDENGEEKDEKKEEKKEGSVRNRDALAALRRMSW